MHLMLLCMLSKVTIFLEFYFKFKQSFLEQVSHFSNRKSKEEISHLGIKRFMFSQLKMSLVPQSYIINYALDSNVDKSHSDLGLWQACCDLFTSLWEQGPTYSIPTPSSGNIIVLSSLLVPKKNECIVAIASHGNNFWNSLTVERATFTLFRHWKWWQNAKFSVFFVCILQYQYLAYMYNINTSV